MSGWLETLAAELYQAEAKKTHLIISIHSREEEIKRSQKSQVQYKAEMHCYINKICKLRGMDRQMLCQIEELCKAQDESQTNLKTIQNNISFIKELQRLKKPKDLRELPPEIRKMIFELLLIERSPIQILEGYKNSCSLAISRICKQVREETYAIFFSLNTFEVIQSNTKAITHFLTESSLRQRHLGHIKLYVSNETSILDCLRALEGCHDLKSLTLIIISVPSFRGAHNPDNLCSLRFNKPSKLNRIEIRTESIQEHQNDLGKTCIILEDVLRYGRCVRPVHVRWNLRSKPIC